MSRLQQIQQALSVQGFATSDSKIWKRFKDKITTTVTISSKKIVRQDVCEKASEGWSEKTYTHAEFLTSLI
jgi:hypothetical protein